MRKALCSISILISIVFLLSACQSEVKMPYSTEEYKNLGWTIEELYDHFDELGFTDIEIDEYTTDNIDIAGMRVFVDNDDDTWFREIVKDEVISTERTIYINLGHFTGYYPTSWTTENSPEFANLAYLDNDSSEWNELWTSFAKSHNGQYLEFDGVITDWYDELWFAGGVSFTVSVEDSNQDFYSWSCIDLIDLNLTGDYHYTKYYVGLISEGQSVHMKVKIVCDEDQIRLDIESFDLI